MTGGSTAGTVAASLPLGAAVLDLLPLLLLVVTLASVGAQLRTVRRDGTAGLSAATWFGLVTSAMFWLGYAVAIADPTMIVINVLTLGVALTLAAAIVRAGVAPASALAPWIGVPLLAWAVVLAGGPAWVLGAGGTALVVGRLLPQLVVALRAEDRSGVSLGAWAGNGGNKVVWTVYGFVIGDAIVAWSSLLAGAVSLAVVAVVLAGRRGRPAVATPALAA